jgi:ribosome biogenesis GTPase
MNRDVFNEGIVVSVTRRKAWVDGGTGDPVAAVVPSRCPDAAVGDRVTLTTTGGERSIIATLPRRNTLTRSYLGRSKTVAVNVDRIFLITAVVPLFNPTFLDRVLGAALYGGIPAEIVVNKVDLGMGETDPLLEPYERLGLPIHRTSTHDGTGIDRFRSGLEDPALQIVVFCGMSGVGKSSLLNTLIPEAERRVGAVSERTGKGKQTTSQSFGYRYGRVGAPPLLIVDTPGIQNFGLSHLLPGEVQPLFPEITAIAARCDFADCGHVREERCAVKDAVREGTLATSRYESYLHILDESERTRRY